MLRIQVTGMERAVNTDMVLLVKYSLDLIEVIGGNRYESSLVGSVNLPVPPSAPVPFASLTEAEVQVWVSSALGEVFLSEAEAKLQIKNNDQKSPQTINGLPWTILK
jgi:hypothetical protein